MKFSLKSTIVLLAACDASSFDNKMCSVQENETGKAARQDDENWSETGEHKA